VAAVVEYAPVTRSPGDTAADIFSQNVENYVSIIIQAAAQVNDVTIVTKTTKKCH
jgi:hypothetical protein